MQALTVVLLELSLDCTHLTTHKSHVTSSADKLLRWLDAMISVDAVSQSTYSIVTKILNKQSQQHAANKKIRGSPVAEEPEQQNYGISEYIPGLQQSDDMYSQTPISENMENAWFG